MKCNMLMSFFCCSSNNYDMNDNLTMTKNVQNAQFFIISHHVQMRCRNFPDSHLSCVTSRRAFIVPY